jgi:hypothetical protein
MVGMSAFDQISEEVVGSTQRRMRPNKPDKPLRIESTSIDATTIREILLMFVNDWRLNQCAQFEFRHSSSMTNRTNQLNLQENPKISTINPNCLVG